MSDIGFGPVGDPPIVNHYPLEDGYGRTTPLVDRRLLEQAQARIAELEAAHRSDRNERWDDSVAPGGMVCAECGDPVESEPCELHGGGLEVADLVRGQLHEALNQRNEYRTERDHWRAEAEKARTPAEKLRAAANVLAEYQQRHGAGCANADDLHAEADRLESEATADDVVELRGES